MDALPVFADYLNDTLLLSCVITSLTNDFDRANLKSAFFSDYFLTIESDLWNGGAMPIKETLVA